MKDQTTEETLAILATWNLQEAVRVNRDVLGGLKAGWQRAKLPSTGRAGFRGVIRQGRQIVWTSEWVSIHRSPEEAWDTAHREVERRVWEAWRTEKGL